METAKEEVQRILDLLPDDATLEDIQYRIYVRQAIAAGLRDVEHGRVVSQEEVERRMARWTQKQK
jgi:predicted transcriptional regulator